MTATTTKKTPSGMISTILRKSRNTKQKRQKLQKMLDERNIPYQVQYQHKYGWVIFPTNHPEQIGRIGHQYFSAKDLIEHGTLDFLSEKNNG